jgi:hypothetical protein
MTQVLTELSFVRYRNIDAPSAHRFFANTGFRLPDSYMEFLCFRSANQTALTFTFVRADGEQWEGGVTEFHNIAPDDDSLDKLSTQIIRPAAIPKRAFLPIASDPGGNWLCLELSKAGVPVVDIDHGTGLVSEVAPNFEAFLGLLKRDVQKS